MSSHQEPEQGILWEQIEEALDVIKGLTGSTRALEDWLNGYTDTFEPVWDALYIRIQQYLLKDLMSLPKRIADRRKEMLAGLRLLGQLPFEPTGIQADDLVSHPMFWSSGTLELIIQFSLAAHSKLRERGEKVAE